MLNFLKKKELAEIEALQDGNKKLYTELAASNFQVELLQKELSNTKAELTKYALLSNVEKERDRILSEIERLKMIQSSLLEKEGFLNKEIEDKKSQIVQLDERILLQEFGLYQPVYDFATSEHYKERLAYIRKEQEYMVIRKEAATCSKVWTIDGSKIRGDLMVRQNIKQILRCFNNECDTLISKVKFSNVASYIEKIRHSAGVLDAINEENCISISPEYVDLKIQELQLAYEYEMKKHEEKEEQKRIREQMREEAKLLKELEEARKNIEKEQKHYTNALVKLNKQLETVSETDKGVLLEKKIEIENHLEKLDTSLKDIDYREANKKAGYVYIISNIGSFGEGIYKIGMTRRLDPYERVDELGDASVPFKFDVHAMIFSDDAPKLEAALHRAFENKKLNMVNHRREFFKCSLEEIEEVVKANYDKTVEFTRVAEAGQFRESEKMKFNKNKLL
ncbi:MAG: DUF4041 domain-containing protein [Lachnospiraceae bacterium]|nr:DUF4041 domain-containing protein [Lachnospiraceae bacterium]MBO5407446.1 DUF4041 domain-containing protein [Bacteroidales bacterium]